MRSPSTTKTALLVVDIQQGLHHPTEFGLTRSTPDLEQNVKTLLATVRAYNSNNSQNDKSTYISSPAQKKEVEVEVKNDGKIEIIHVHHLSLEPNSPLRPDHIINWTSMSGDDSLRGKKGADAMDCAAPMFVSNFNFNFNSNSSQSQSQNQGKTESENGTKNESKAEKRFTKTTNSAFIGTELESYLRGLKVRQLLICGLTMEHCISTTVRMASNLAVTVPAPARREDIGTNGRKDDGDVDEGEKALEEKRRAGDPEGIVLVRDCCAAFGKVVPAISSSLGGKNKGEGEGEKFIDAETVMAVNVESLREAFCEVVDVRDVVGLLGEA